MKLFVLIALGFSLVGCGEVKPLWNELVGEDSVFYIPVDPVEPVEPRFYVKNTSKPGENSVVFDLYSVAKTPVATTEEGEEGAEAAGAEVAEAAGAETAVAEGEVAEAAEETKTYLGTVYPTGEALEGCVAVSESDFPISVVRVLESTEEGVEDETEEVELITKASDLVVSVAFQTSWPVIGDIAWFLSVDSVDSNPCETVSDEEVAEGATEEVAEGATEEVAEGATEEVAEEVTEAVDNS